MNAVSDEPEKGREALEEKVYDGESYRPFGELTAADARGRADELKQLTGFGPTMRVRPVAQGWTELAALMDEEGAATVADLATDRVTEFAERLWVIQPSRSIMQDAPPDPDPEPNPDPGRNPTP